jgi:hypothetical protein
MLRALERTVGFAEGVVMSFDPDVLLPTGFAATSGPNVTDALVACRNEQLDEDFLKFRDLAVSKSRVVVASRQADPWTRSSPRWLEILDVRGHGHELRAAVDMFRVSDGRIVWRFLICDWKTVTGQLTAAP